MLRYLKKLEARDLSLTASMIPLGSCTMKLNASAEMFPISWPGFAALHPFVPGEQAAGYHRMCGQLEEWLANITGFAAVSLQPNAGSQGEFAGLLAIRRYHESRGEGNRNVCLIPMSAHGTNPASAVMVGMKVVSVTCAQSAANGDVDLDDLRARAEEHSENLAAIMVTYPSTHGVYERGIREICDIVHEYGGQVYMDGANLNAQIGLTSPGYIGAMFAISICTRRFASRTAVAALASGRSVLPGISCRSCRAIRWRKTALRWRRRHGAVPASFPSRGCTSR